MRNNSIYLVWVLLVWVAVGFAHASAAESQRLPDGSPIGPPKGQAKPQPKRQREWQPLQRQLEVPPLAHDPGELICDGDVGAGTGGSRSATTTGQLTHRGAGFVRRFQETARGVERIGDLLRLEDLLRLDVDGDGQLSFRELLALDEISRRALLSERDANSDRKLSRSELAPMPERLSSAPGEPTDYPSADEPVEEAASPKPRRFRNLRRLGLGEWRPSPPARRPFARAATFATGPGVVTGYVRKPSPPARGGDRCSRSGARLQATDFRQ